MTDFPTMTVGIVLFNGDPGLLDQCLASVAREAAAADVDVEVLLFDNASTEPVRPPQGQWSSVARTTSGSVAPATASLARPGAL